MINLVSTVGQNQKKSLMLILGSAFGEPTAGVYVYESKSFMNNNELISVGTAQFAVGEDGR
jgi:hypothetical protein